MMLSLLACGLVRFQTPESLTIQPSAIAEVVGPEGAMQVKWTVPCDSAEVAFGESIDRFGPSTTVRNTDSWDDPDMPFARIKFHGGPMNGRTLVVGMRFEGFNGAANFRDLGGYPAQAGKVTRYGLMFRANALARLSEPELAKIEKLGIAADYDLRGDSEVKIAPDHMPENVKYVRLPIVGHIPTAFAKDPTRPYCESFLTEVYKQMVDEQSQAVFGPWLKEVVAGPKAEKFVVHCSAGKDRTGVATAILLSLLGVHRDTIIADFTLTNKTYSESNIKLISIKPTDLSSDDMKQMLLAYPEAIKQALDYVDTKYGSVEAYALGPCGLTKTDLDKLRKDYLQ